MFQIQRQQKKSTHGIYHRGCVGDNHIPSSDDPGYPILVDAMIAIVIATIVIIGLIGVIAAIDISGQMSADEVAAQCTPSRPRLLTGYQPDKQPEYQEYQPRRYRWRGLERSRSIRKEKVRVKKWQPDE